MFCSFVHGLLYIVCLYHSCNHHVLCAVCFFSLFFFSFVCCMVRCFHTLSNKQFSSQVKYMTIPNLSRQIWKTTRIYFDYSFIYDGVCYSLVHIWWCSLLPHMTITHLFHRIWQNTRIYITSTLLCTKKLNKQTNKKKKKKS